MAAALPPVLRLGIEIEALFDPHPYLKESNFIRFAFAAELAKGHHSLRSGYNEETEHYKKWLIKADDSLRGYQKHGPFAYEVISPILYVDSSGTWRQESRGIVTHLETNATLLTNETCGLHIHMSPCNGSWSMAELRSISFAVIYFDEALLALLPEHRRRNFYLYSNYKNNNQLCDLTMDKCWARLLAMEDYKAVFEVMQDDDTECRLAWNFGNLLGWEQTTGETIEWRQPPGVITAAECLAWSELAIEFIQAVKDWENIGEEVGRLYKGDVEGLRNFLDDRGIYPGRDSAVTNCIFQGKSGKVPVVTAESRVDYTAVYDNVHDADRSEFNLE